MPRDTAQIEIRPPTLKEARKALVDGTKQHACGKQTPLQALYGHRNPIRSAP